MSNKTPNPATSFTDDAKATFLIRWRGRQAGPFTEAVIKAKLAANQIGLLHQILHDGEWITLRDYLAERGRREQAARHGELPLTHLPPAQDPLERWIAMVDSPGTRKAMRGLIVVGCVCASLWFVTSLVKFVEHSNPATRQAVKAVWREIQDAESQARAAGRESTSQYFERLKHEYTQIDADDADVELRDFIRDRLQAAKTLAAISKRIEEEVQSNQPVEELIGNAGVLGGALLSGVDSQYAAFWQSAGPIAGALFSSAARRNSVASIHEKYRIELTQATNQFEQLTRLKKSLAARLGRRYNVQLLDSE